MVSFTELQSPQPSIKVKLERQFYVANFTKENQSLVWLPSSVSCKQSAQFIFAVRVIRSTILCRKKTSSSDEELLGRDKDELDQRRIHLPVVPLGLNPESNVFVNSVGRFTYFSASVKTLRWDKCELFKFNLALKRTVEVVHLGCLSFCFCFPSVF